MENIRKRTGDRTLRFNNNNNVQRKFEKHLACTFIAVLTNYVWNGTQANLPKDRVEFTV